jgi:hypothetical protein
MNIVTNHPIEVMSGCCGYSNLEGTDVVGVKAFQDWMDLTHPLWVKYAGKAPSNLNKGAGYGTFGNNTKKAYAQYGKEWELTQTKDTPITAVPPINIAPPAPASVAPLPVKVKIYDRFKALPMVAKVGIGVGVAGIVGFIIYKIIK